MTALTDAYREWWHLYDGLRGWVQAPFSTYQRRSIVVWQEAVARQRRKIADLKTETVRRCISTAIPFNRAPGVLVVPQQRDGRHVLVRLLGTRETHWVPASTLRAE